MTKMPRSSSTSSWTILGTWKSIKDVRTAKAIPSVLLAVELDDQLLGDGGVDLLPLRPLQDLAGEVVVVGLEPGRHRRGEIRRVAHHLLRARPRRDRHDGVRA